VISLYNAYMGGVDVSGQRVSVLCGITRFFSTSLKCVCQMHTF